MLKKMRLKNKKIKKLEHPNSFTKWIKTDEDWHPSYKSNSLGNPLKCDALEVKCQKIPSSKQWIVCVWGADDFGMEVVVKNRTESISIFNKIIDFSTINYLFKLGLNYV